MPPVVEADRQFPIVITPKGLRRGAMTWSRAPSLVLRSIQKAWQLSLLDIKQSSFGLYLGNAWLLLEPLLQAAAYYMLLTVIFNVSGADATFAFFFVGITFWRSHATLVTSAPYFLISKGHTYVEQGFGLPIAFMEALANELIMLGMRLVVLAAFLIIAGYEPQWTWLAVPVVVAIQFTFSMALHLWLSIVGAVFKDASRFVGHFVWLWWYMSPGLYSVRRIPDWALVVYNANPFAHLMPAYHSLLLDGVVPEATLLPLAAILLFSTALLLGGVWAVRNFSYTMVKYA